MNTQPRTVLAAAATALGRAATGIADAVRPADPHPTPERQPRTIDCTRYDYSFRSLDGGQRGSVACWTVPPGGKPFEGDWLILRNGPDRSSRYRVTKVDICWNVDPPTMWMADLVFDPRRGTEE